AERSSQCVIRVVGFGPRRTEHGHRGPDVVEGVEAFNELGQDPQHAPRIGMVAELFDRAALEQHLVGRRRLLGNDETAGAAAIRHALGQACCAGSVGSMASDAATGAATSPLACSGLGSGSTDSLARFFLSAPLLPWRSGSGRAATGAGSSSGAGSGVTLSKSGSEGRALALAGRPERS